MNIFKIIAGDASVSDNTYNKICSSNLSAEQRAAAGCDVSSTESITTPISNAISVAIAVAMVIAVLGIIYGGFLLMTANGDTSKVQKGKSAILYSSIGVVVALLAYAIVHFVISGIGF